MKTNHRRKNPDEFNGVAIKTKLSLVKPTGAPNYSVMGYLARMRHGVEGMEHDNGHRGNAKDIKETKTARKRTDRRIANRSVLKIISQEMT